MHDACVLNAFVFCIFLGLGVDAGDTVRVARAGNSGAWGSTSGDLIIKIKATPFCSSPFYLQYLTKKDFV